MPAIRTGAAPGPRQHKRASTVPRASRTKAEQLLAEIEGFLRDHPFMTEGEFGRLSVGYNEVIRFLREGIEPSDAKCRKVRAFIASWR